MRHVNLRVHGKVQGVFYRQSAQDKARELGVSGWARNEEDGTVYIEGEGEIENLERFIEWCRQGPPASSVTKVDHEFTDDIQGWKDFTISY